VSDFVRLDPESVAALAEVVAPSIARLVLEAIVDTPTTVRSSPGAREGGAHLLTAAQVADRFAVGRAWVYQHAEELGARRLGQGPKPRLRFDAHEVAAALDSREACQRPRRARSSGPRTRPHWSSQRLVPDPLKSLPTRWQEAMAAGRRDTS
jgi:hypothetical protein